MARSFQTFDISTKFKIFSSLLQAVLDHPLPHKNYQEIHLFIPTKQQVLKLREFDHFIHDAAV